MCHFTSHISIQQETTKYIHVLNFTVCIPQVLTVRCETIQDVCVKVVKEMSVRMRQHHPISQRKTSLRAYMYMYMYMYIIIYIYTHTHYREQITQLHIDGP